MLLSELKIGMKLKYGINNHTLEVIDIGDRTVTTISNGEKLELDIREFDGFSFYPRVEFMYKDFKRLSFTQ
jgi:hypothetical protein